jgi:hypothetical protein
LTSGIAGNGLARERESVMRSFLGFSLLLLSFAAATYDGFRERDRARTAPNGTQATETGGTHVLDYGAGLNPPR